MKTIAFCYKITPKCKYFVKHREVYDKMERNDIQKLLIQIGRKIVKEKGTEALTVRKLSEASGCSVGAIYNQFANMENFVVVQNYLTLDELSAKLSAVKTTEDPFADMNRFLQVFVDYLRHHRVYSYFYMKKVVKIIAVIQELLQRIVPDMERPERVLSSQILWLTLFAVSSFLTKDILDSLVKVNKKTICQLMMNTFVAGLTVLEKRG